MVCIKCQKYLRYKDGNYAKWKFGRILCISCSPMKKYNRAGKPVQDKQEELLTAETTRIEDISII